MPIVVDEVVISVEVTGGGAPGGQGAAGAGPGPGPSGDAGGGGGADPQVIVEAAVERVLEILERRKER